MAITFNNVDPNARASAFYLELQALKRTFGGSFIPPTGLFIGMYDPAKTSVVDYVPIQVSSKDDGGLKFGFGSHIHRQLLKLPNAVFDQGGGIWVIPIPEESGGTAATDTITFTGTAATTAGTFAFLISGDRVTVAVKVGDDPTAIAAALEDALTAKQNLPVTGVAALGVVTNTAKFKGTQGNQILQVINPNGESDENANPSGITVALGNADGYLSTGATDPDIEDAFFDSNGEDKLGDRWYTDFSCPFTDTTSIGYYKTLGDQRSDPSVNRFFKAYLGYVTETEAEAKLIGPVLNSKWLSPSWDPRYQGTMFEYMAENMGLVLDSFNLAPSQPYKNQLMVGPADATVSDITTKKYDALFKTGMGFSRIINNNLITGDMALSYRKNLQGGEDNSWYDTVSTSVKQAKAYSLEQLFKTDKYARAVVITNDDVTAVSFSIAPKDVIADVTKLINELWGPNAWTKNVEAVIESLSAVINPNNSSRIDSEVTDDPAQALRIIAFKLAYLVD